MGQVLGSMTMSGLLGLVVYVLILLPVLVSALNAMALDAVTGPASAMLATILDVIPSLFAGAVLLAVAYVIARLVSGLISSLLAGAGFDTLMVRLGLGKTDAPADRTPSALVGTLIVVAVMLFASMEAAELLGFAALVELISRFVVLGGQVILGLIIFAVSLFLANVAGNTVQASGSTSAGRVSGARRARLDHPARRSHGPAADGARERDHQHRVRAGARRRRRRRGAGVRPRRTRCGGSHGRRLADRTQRRRIEIHSATRHRPGRSAPNGRAVYTERTGGTGVSSVWEKLMPPPGVLSCGQVVLCRILRGQPGRQRSPIQ